MIDVCALGCGPIRTGEGAAAPFNGVHICGKIWPAGDLIPWPNCNGIIPQSTIGGLFKFGDWPWDGTAALFVATEMRGNISRLGGVEGMANW